MFGNIIVLIIVFLAIIFISRRIYRFFSNNTVECGCGLQEGCSGCSIAGSASKTCCESSQEPKT